MNAAVSRGLQMVSPSVRLGSSVDKLNIRVKSYAERPDHPTGDVAYVLSDIWTTRDGSWQRSDKPYGLTDADQWAWEFQRDWNAPDAPREFGADHHLFGAVVGLDGKLIRGADFWIWSGENGDKAFEQLANPDLKVIHAKTVGQPGAEMGSGWMCVAMAGGGGANYDPQAGQRGPYCFCPAGASDVLVGAGMPGDAHVSIFAVWRAVQVTQHAPPSPPVNTVLADQLQAVLTSLSEDFAKLRTLVDLIH